MKNKKLSFIYLFGALFCFLNPANAQKVFTLQSPDGKLNATVSVSDIVEYSVSHEGDIVLDRSAVSMTLNNASAYGKNVKLTGSSIKSVNRTIDAFIYKRNKVVDNYNELTLKFKGDYSIIFRAYDDGIAYRFVSLSKKPFVVENEQAEFNFPADNKLYVAYANARGTLEQQFQNSFEQPYHHIALSGWDKERLGMSPLLVESVKGKKVCIAEADLMSYPGMFLYPGDKNNSLKGMFAPYPKIIEQGGHNRLQGMVKSRESYIAKYDKGVNFPWRVVIVSGKDSELTDSDMIYKLSTPPQGDFSWVRPGKVAWDWWNDWNLYNVDFRAGINNETYKYYIDFAAEYGIEYVILDEGWAVNLKADLYQIIPEINLKELVDYAAGKNVGLILWAGYYAFNKDIEGICKHYGEMGIKGFKIDFMDRDDQPMVDFHRKTAEIAAKYKVMIDYHGTYKPTGLQRTYPNVINFEGVNGLEQMKWSGPELDQVTYDVIIPFIRQIAGPMDYTQGAMRNATKDNYRAVNNEAMSQGTRCRQLAEYVIFESPLNMLCDSPSNYRREKECTDFIAAIPTVWDNTVALDAEVGKYVAVARQNGNNWYVGALTDRNARDIVLDLSFLGDGNFRGELFRDGINADRAACDYKKEIIDISADRKLKISMAPGGGCAIKIYKK